MKNKNIINPSAQASNVVYTNEILYSDFLTTKNSIKRLEENLRWEDLGNEYELNDMFFRCENFKNEHIGKHIVFNGCSVTWGSGLGIEEVWSKKTYNFINSREQTSGYFNLSFPGQSIQNIVITLFKYFKNNGNPDYVFINLPDIYRLYSYHKETNSIVDGFYSEDQKKILELLAYQYYFMLEQYCFSNNIKLYSFTWCNELNKSKQFIRFKTFHTVDMDKMSDFILKYIKNNNNKYLQNARDGEHYGTAYHEFWANKVYEDYLNDKNI
jgi:hypothetical protein